MATRKDHPGKSHKAPPLAPTVRMVKRRRRALPALVKELLEKGGHPEDIKKFLKYHGYPWKAVEEAVEEARRSHAKELSLLSDPAGKPVVHKAARTSADRVRRHREEMRRKGMRPITLWVPDTRSPAFLAAAAEACRRANAADKTDPAVTFLEDLVEQSFRDLDESGL
jgi:hypothetical protein